MLWLIVLDLDCLLVFDVDGLNLFVCELWWFDWVVVFMLYLGEVVCLFGVDIVMV